MPGPIQQNQVEGLAAALSAGAKMAEVPANLVADTDFPVDFAPLGIMNLSAVFVRVNGTMTSIPANIMSATTAVVNSGTSVTATIIGIGS